MSQYVLQSGAIISILKEYHSARRIATYLDNVIAIEFCSRSLKLFDKRFPFRNCRCKSCPRHTLVSRSLPCVANVSEQDR